MNRTGVFICNYNGKEFTINCIRSLYEQTEQNFDIYVVDNASTDGSVQEIRCGFSDVALIENEENLGGAGGFDRGLCEGIRKNYEYIMLLDNDVRLDANVVANMEKYLDEHGDVGIVGAKVLIMDRPDTIQDYGNYLDFNQYKEINAYSYMQDTADLPNVNECDYVPTCAVMIRTEMLRKSGTMPIDNFIYYDDIELSYKMHLWGWKVVALGNARVWHKGGFRKAVINTFSRYYFLRNRLHFFARYIPEEKINDFTEKMLSEVFSRVYGFYIKGMDEVLQTTLYAFDDFLHMVRGKAAANRINNLSNYPTPFEKVIQEKHNIRINLIDNFISDRPDEIFGILMYIIINLNKVSKQDIIYVSLEKCHYTEEEFWTGINLQRSFLHQGEKLPEICLMHEEGDFDLELQMCEHVSKVKENILPCIYVDRYCNCISCLAEYNYFAASEEIEKLFKTMYRPLMLDAIRKIREYNG